MNLDTLVNDLAQRLTAQGQRLASAESCTGGLVAQSCTDLAGSSAWFERGLVTYSNEAKQELLGVPAAVFEHSGAVSRDCALAMASGLLTRAPVDWTLAVTGIAGPGGGTADKPVGTVWFAWAGRGREAWADVQHFSGDRRAVREAAARHALSELLRHV